MGLCGGCNAEERSKALSNIGEPDVSVCQLTAPRRGKASATSVALHRLRILGVVVFVSGLSAMAGAAWPGGGRSLADKLKYGPGIANHPVHVVPSRAVRIPQGWPLDPDGSINCSTCHTALPSLEGRTGTNLRGGDVYEADNSAFCSKCHRPQARRTAASMHWEAMRFAHVREDITQKFGTTVSGLDSESRTCLSCHDGVTATESHNPTGRNLSSQYSGPSGGNHPIGIVYAASNRARNATPLRPASFLPESIRLPQGKVSCVSCHNLYAEGRHRLSVPVEGSNLCFACHELD